MFRLTIKNINFLFVLQLLLLVKVIFCKDDSLLSKFHQNGFKIKDERIQLMRYNKSCFRSFEIKAFKYNRTTTAHNISFTVKLDLEDKIEVVVQSYKFLSNEYRRFPLRFQANLKKMVDANVVGLSSVKNCGNVKSFYFYKDIPYHLCNFVIDETRFPPLIPTAILPRLTQRLPRNNLRPKTRHTINKTNKLINTSKLRTITKIKKNPSSRKTNTRNLHTIIMPKAKMQSQNKNEAEPAV